jgi:CRISPR-associated endonuclease Cas1
MNITPLLPLRAALIELRFLAPARLQPHHAPAVSGFVRSLVEDADDYQDWLWTDALESGKTAYQPGDAYCFALYLLPGGEALFERILRQLRGLPGSAPRTDEKMPLRDNVELTACRDAFGAADAVECAADLRGYGLEELREEAARWQALPAWRLRWRSPLRILRDKVARPSQGDERFCHDATELSYPLLYSRLHDSLAGLLRRRGEIPPPRGAVEDAPLRGGMAWVEAGYRDAGGAYLSMGGMVGELEFPAPPPEHALLWVLGHYLGIGQRRAFGWGRYGLENGDVAGKVSINRAVERQTQFGANVKLAFDTPRGENALEVSISTGKMALGEMGEAGITLLVSGALQSLGTSAGRLTWRPLGAVENAEEEKAEEFSIAWENLQAVLLVGGHRLTTPALRAALWHGVPVHFASGGGHYQGVAWNGAAAAEDARLWMAQQAWLAQPDKALAAARSIVETRLRHQREVLRLRNPEGGFDAALAALERLAAQCRGADSLERLNGLEGQGGKEYFQALQALVAPEFGFDGRNRRPPQDPFNALLSLGYTILYAHVDTLIRVCRLSPWIGFYHQPHGNHAVLASDLMEPFRHLVERVALNALSQKALRPEDFFMHETQGCRLQDAARRKYLALLSLQFEAPFMALRDAEPRKLHEHLRAQVLALRLWITGKAESFDAWRMR